jgi:hypothetical protein
VRVALNNNNDRQDHKLDNQMTSRLRVFRASDFTIHDATMM